jgi:sortase (surface protein transpeptidase)
VSACSYPNSVDPGFTESGSAPKAKSLRSGLLAIAVATTVVTLVTGASLAGNAAAAPASAASTINVIRSNATALSAAVRLNPPVATPDVEAEQPAPVAPIVNVSSCRTDLPGAVATVTIPSISYACPVYSGGQATLDSGAVTWISEPASITTLATHAGGAGTIWLAGHRTAHGGAFALIPNLADGAVVTVTDSTGSASYRIVGRVYVQVSGGFVLDSTGTPSNAATLSALLRPDLGDHLEPRIVIQTCDGLDYRWMVYGDLITS